MQLVPTQSERPTQAEKLAEAEALMRIAQATAAELPVVVSSHWHDPLKDIAQSLVDSAYRNGYKPTLTEVD